MEAVNVMNKRSSLKVVGALGAVALAVTACGGGASEAGAEAESVTLTYATFVGADHPTSKAFQKWSEMVTEETDGTVTFDTHYDGSLCAAGELAACISNGTADIGFVIPGYEPALFPLTTVDTIGFVTNDLQAQVDGFGDFYAESEELQAEFADQSLEIVYSTASYPYLIASTKETPDFEDLQGISLRASGDMAGPLSELGINPVAISIAESYESIERGVIDGISTALDGLVDAGLQEVTPYIYDLGEYSGNGMMHHVVVNTDVWDDLPADAQKVFTSAGEEVGGAFFADFDNTEEHCAMLEESGVTVSSIGPADVGEQWAETAQRGQIDAWAERAGQAHEDPEAIFDQYVEKVKANEDGDSSTPISRCM